MPTVRIDMFPGRTIEQKRALVDEVTKAIVSSLGVTPESVGLTIWEMEKHHSARGGVLASDK